MEETNSVSMIAVTAAVGAVVLLFVLLCSIGKKGQKEEEKESDKKEQKPSKQEKQPSKKSRQTQRLKRSTSVPFSHAWLAGSLKGHSSPVLDFDCSPNGKYVISIAEDRSIMLWSTKEFEKKEHKFIRGSVDFDHATKVKFSPDSKSFIVSLANGNTIRAFRIGKKDDGSPGNIEEAVTFEKKHKADIIHIGIATTGKFFMTCSRDTTMIVWSIKGDVLAEVDTHQMNNSYGAVSPCGRFVATSGFTPDVKVWQVCFSKSGDFNEVKRAFELKGHSAGVYSFSFSSDSSRMASVSKDGTWKYWDTNVQFDMNQDPYLLFTGSHSGSVPCLISLSPDGRSVAIGWDTTVALCNAQNGEDEEIFENVHSEELSQLEFDITGRYLLSSGDKRIHVLHNVVGYKAIISDLTSKEKSASSQTMKERLRKQMQEARNALDRVLHGEVNGVADKK